MKRNLIVLLVAFTLVLNFSGCAQKAGQESPAAPVQQASGTVKLEDLKLAIGSAPGPVTYPLARMAEQNSNIILKPWQGGEQLTAMITTKEVQLCSTPLNNAVLSYNKGLDTQLLMVTVWGMLYVMSTESDVKSLQDLKGKEVALSGKGGIHDLIFRHLLIKNGINPDSDLTLSYLDMSEASSRLAAGQLKYAVLNEPQSSIATLNAQKSGVQLHRVLDLTQEWNELPGQENARMPMAGIIVVNGSGITSEQAAGFAKAYIDTAEWVNNNPAEIGPIVEKHVPAMKAAAVSQSLKYARLQPQHAVNCQAEVEAFFKELSQTADIRAFGGKIPDAKFYCQAN
ncbi:MAG: NMT1/THI5 like protein [Firmicutes bacterium ADurb.Bin373]|nr:ABC transporter substrate-binding protein [Bacillota bacterium]OQA10641.1 MAG: NMT1/THI5 like protein [Firmicutes bacterium ADurb.Bin373]